MNGIYVLIIQLSEDTNVNVGKLGPLHFPKGLFAYVGSAQVAMEKRVERHLRKEKQVFWHIDYLLQSPNARILKIFTKTAGKTEECSIAGQIAEKGEAVPDFGCSDCRCKSHLHSITDYRFLTNVMKEYKMP